MGALLKCENVSLGYEGDVVTKNINFTVSSGDYLCIVGENGSGKSTLIKALLGLKPQLSGNIEFCGGMAKNEIGYLPQQTLVQRDFPASVREIVLSGCMNRCGLRPFYNKDEKKLAHDMMRRLDIEPLTKRCYRELSGGQQQRVLLARALCAAKEVLLLDEPVAGLDPIVTEQMYDLIEKLNKEGITILMISHDIGAALRYANKILHLGDSVFFGTKAEYLESESGKSFLARQKGGEY